MVQAPDLVEMAPAVMVEINPAEEPAAAPPNPDEKKTPEKIKYKGENNFPSLPESGEER